MKGPERLPVCEVFKKIAIGEMKHTEFLAEKIVARRGVATVTPLSIVQPATVRDMPEASFAAEPQAIKGHAERADQAEEFGDERPGLELEYLVAQEATHAEEFEKLVAGDAPTGQPAARKRKGRR